MFSKLISTTKWCSDVIYIDDLISLIKEPKEIDYSDYYNYKLYNAVAYKAHGVFGGLGKEFFKSFSNYLFFDIDGVEDIETIKKDLSDLGANLVYKSLSGKGIHFLVKLNFEVKSVNEFDRVYASYFNYFLMLGFKLDNQAKGLSRSVVIGYDENPIFTGKTMDIQDLKVSFSNVKEEKHTIVNDTFYEKQFRTKIEIPNDKDYIIQEVSNYVDIYLPNDIKDGEKHKRYKRAIIEFMTLNQDATIKDIEMWLTHVNSKQNQKMINVKLFSLIRNTYEWVKKENIKAKGRKKIIHFNSNSNLSPKEKQSIAAKEMGKIKTDKTFVKIQQFMIDNDYKPTQKEVANSLGLGIATIKRHWKNIIRK